MDNEKTCLAVIPARSGSTRVPQKNIRELGGVPLLAYTIAAARESGLFSRIVVSTDSEAFAQIARAWGAEVPFLRDPTLADAHTPVSAATLDVIRRLDPELSLYQRVAQLMPNCPLRTAEDIRDSYQAFRKSGAEFQISVVDPMWLNPWWAAKLDENQRIQPLFPEAYTMRSQDLEPLYCPSGAVWWAQTRALLERGTFLVPERVGHPLGLLNAFDIDTEADWRMGEALSILLQKPHMIDEGKTI